MLYEKIGEDKNSGFRVAVRNEKYTEKNREMMS